MHVGIFHLEHINVIWGHSVHFSEKRGENSKATHRRAKWTKLLPRGCMHIACILIFFTLIMSRSFGVIRCTFPKKGRDAKTVHHRAERTNQWHVRNTCSHAYSEFKCVSVYGIDFVHKDYMQIILADYQGARATC